MHTRVRLIVTPIWGFILAVSLYSCSSSPEKTGDGYGYEDAGPADMAVVSEPETPPPPQKPAVRIALRDDVPGQYVVKRGDTLWDIASLFLRDPWLWPEIWYFNPQINNPHLIYPGDILTLVYVDGQPQLRLTRDGTQLVEPSVPVDLQSRRLSPRIRTESLAQAIPTIPVSDIEPFLTQPRVISEKELEQSPYIVSSLDQHLINAEGNTIYARRLDYTDDVRYNIFRPGRVFRDPQTNEILGYETTLVSEAKLVKPGDPATLVITRSIRETLNGDRILPADKGRISYNFIPKPPSSDVEGQILALVDAVSQTAQRQVVVINLGEREGMEVGTVLAIDQRGEVVRDPYTRGGTRSVKLPDHRAGLLMVFRVFERVSYGLIVDTSRAVKLYDMVRNPASSAEIISR